MPDAKVIKQRSRTVQQETKLVEKTKPASMKKQPQTQLKILAQRKPRAAICQRCLHSNRCSESVKPQNTVSTMKRDMRARSSYIGPKPTGISYKTPTTLLKTSGSAKQAPINPTSKETTSKLVAHEIKKTSQPKAQLSSKAFTITHPDPRKHREIQQKAEAELAALEELRLSRAMAYVTIKPSSVGGCMSLEEVRLKQQQQLMQARGRPRQMKQCGLQSTAG